MTSLTKIAFVIASHERLPIVEQNIKYLLQYGSVFVVVSTDHDYNVLLGKFHPKNYPEVYIKKHPNEPLGDKWQCAVEMTKYWPDLLIPIGSDDFISKDYIENAKKLIVQGYEFIGVNGWLMSDGINHYKAKYRHLNDFPAGSGRVFTRSCLDKINWQVFDTKRSRLLDDMALSKMKEAKIKTYISQDMDKDGLKILAMKGKWETLNPLDKFLKSPTIKWNRVLKLPNDFPTIKL